MNDTTRKPTSHLPPFGIRMQPELRAKIEAAALESGRSLNAELVYRLEQSFTPDLARPTPAVIRLLRETLEALEQGSQGSE